MRRATLLLTVLAFVIGACSPAADPTTTTSTPATTITTVVAGPNGEDREIVMPDCSAAPSDLLIVCEVVDLITKAGMGVSTWESGPVETSWQAGPFSYPTEVIVPSAERFEGTPQVFRFGEQVRVLHGPWQVVIRGINPRTSRRVLARWEVHRSWVGVTTRPANGSIQGTMRDGRLMPGSSERHLAASELRLRGASEVFFLGASERRLGGASELRFLAASQWIAKGASERRFAGASEWRTMGASEQRLRGASERRLAGASERLMFGASERRLGGASERGLGGASEARLGGASEARLGSNYPQTATRKG